jgi:hypothetical protein
MPEFQPSTPTVSGRFGGARRVSTIAGQGVRQKDQELRGRLRGSQRDTPISAVREGTKCVLDAKRKLHELMQSWDYLLPSKNAPAREDYDLRSFGRVAGKGDMTGPVIVQSADHTAGHSRQGKNEGRVFILDVEIVDCTEGGITAVVRLQPA